MSRPTPRRLRALGARVLRRAPPRQAAPGLSEMLLELARQPSVAPVPTPGATQAAAGSLRIATVIPSFRRGSGGHTTIVRLMRALRDAGGHDVSLWLEDCEGRHARESGSLTQRSFEDFFASDGIPLHTSFEHWRGADVVLATGWQTVARAMRLPGTRAHTYLVQDHEPDFYATSAESLAAQRTYRLGLHCIAASEWLAQLLRDRYQASASHFDLAADHALYRPPATARREDLVVFYARAVTPRRAVPLGLAALTELAARRPNVEIALYGENAPLDAPFAHRNLGVLDERGLAALYAQATVGMVLSLTNPSLIGLEMMAAGLACVELASDSMLASFGAEGPLRLADPDPLALCAAIERLLEDTGGRERAGRAGVELMAGRSWAGAAEQVEHGLRLALAANG